MKRMLPLLISAALGSLSTNAFADTLSEIYNLAKENDPTLLSAAANKDAAFEAINSTRASILPQIALTAGYDINRGEVNNITNDSDGWNAGINFSQELYNRSSWISLDTAEKTARQDRKSTRLNSSH